MNRAARRARRSQTISNVPKGWAWERREVTDQWRAAFPSCARIRDFYINCTYTVQRYVIATQWGEVTHLVIRRHDERPVHSWTDMQRIKDDIAGPGATAVEVYPPDCEVVDQVNNYHLWVLPCSLPFGLHFPGGGM